MGQVACLFGFMNTYIEGSYTFGTEGQASSRSALRSLICTILDDWDGESFDFELVKLSFDFELVWYFGLWIDVVMEW